METTSGTPAVDAANIRLAVFGKLLALSILAWRESGGGLEIAGKIKGTLEAGGLCNVVNA